MEPIHDPSDSHPITRIAEKRVYAKIPEVSGCPKVNLEGVFDFQNMRLYLGARYLFEPCYATNLNPESELENLNRLQGTTLSKACKTIGWLQRLTGRGPTYQRCHF